MTPSSSLRGHPYTRLLILPRSPIRFGKIGHISLLLRKIILTYNLMNVHRENMANLYKSSVMQDGNINIYIISKIILGVECLAVIVVRYGGIPVGNTFGYINCYYYYFFFYSTC